MGKCGMKWEYCFNDNTNPTHMDLNPHHTRGFGEAGCIDPFPLTTTTAEYKDKKLGGHYWRVTTKAFGKIPVPGPGNFDMIQVMDGHGNRIQPAWDAFAKANKQTMPLPHLWSDVYDSKDSRYFFHLLYSAGVC